MINPDYEITEEDIQAVINYLKIYKPEKADRETAVEVLGRLYSQLHVLDHIDPEAIKSIAENL